MMHISSGFLETKDLPRLTLFTCVSDFTIYNTMPVETFIIQHNVCVILSYTTCNLANIMTLVQYQ